MQIKNIMFLKNYMIFFDENTLIKNYFILIQTKKECQRTIIMFT